MGSNAELSGERSESASMLGYAFSQGWNGMISVKFFEVIKFSAIFLAANFLWQGLQDAPNWYKAGEIAWSQSWAVIAWLLWSNPGDKDGA